MLNDREWIKANPTRFFRIVLTDRPWSSQRFPGLMGVKVTRVADDRRSWSYSNLMVVGEFVDTDLAIEFALTHWHDVLFPQLLANARRRREARP